MPSEWVEDRGGRSRSGSFSPSEYAVVAAEAERQGWSVGGWVGALAECAERLGPAPEGGGLDAVAWGRVGERAGSLAAAGRVLADAGVEECGQALERAAHRLSLMCRAQAFAVRNAGAEHNLEAARRGELLAMQLGAEFRHREGASRRRVKVMLTERAAVVVRDGVGSTGEWTPSDAQRPTTASSGSTTRTRGSSSDPRPEPTNPTRPTPHAWAGWGETPLGRVPIV